MENTNIHEKKVFATREFCYEDIAEKLKEFGCEGTDVEVEFVLSETPELPSEIVTASHPEYLIHDAIETALTRNKIAGGTWWAKLLNAGVRRATCRNCSHYRNECYYCWERDGKMDPNEWVDNDCKFAGDFYQLAYDLEGDTIALDIYLVLLATEPDIPAVVECLASEDSLYKEDIERIKRSENYAVNKWSLTKDFIPFFQFTV